MKESWPGVDVVNPNGLVNQNDNVSRIMFACYEQILSCDALAFSPVNGIIGLGVYQEILFAQGLGLPIYEVYGGKVYFAGDSILFYLPSNSDGCLSSLNKWAFARVEVTERRPVGGNARGAR